MKTFFIFSVVLFFIWIVLILYRDIQNKIRNKITNQKQFQTLSVAKPPIIKKNLWLYPDDEFGKMEKGVVNDTNKIVNSSIEIKKDNPEDLDNEIEEFWH
jgi:hypothetical protein